MSRKDTGAPEDGQDAEPRSTPADPEPIGPGVDLESYLRTATTLDRVLTAPEGAPLPENNVLDAGAEPTDAAAEGPVGLSADDVAALLYDDLDGDPDGILSSGANPNLSPDSGSVSGSDPAMDAMTDEAFRAAMREGESIQSVLAETASPDLLGAHPGDASEIEVALGPDDEDERSLEEILASVQDNTMEEALDLGDPLPDLSAPTEPVSDAAFAPPAEAALDDGALDQGSDQQDVESRNEPDRHQEPTPASPQPTLKARRQRTARRPIRIVKRPVVKVAPAGRRTVAPTADAETHLQEAVRLRQSGDADSAIRNYQHVVRLAPERGEAWAGLGVLLQQTGKPDPAIVCLRRAIGLSPGNGGHWSDLGNALRAANRLEEAHRAQDRALSLAPGDVDIHHDAGLVARDLGDLDAALHAFRRAELLGCHDPALAWDIALARLLDGQLQAGFVAFEARWSLPGNPPRHTGLPRWNGEDLTGKFLLLHAEHDLGDTLQFSRYALQLRARGARVLFEVQPSLRRLFEESETFEDIDIVERQDGAPSPKVDFQLPLLSAPAHFDLGAGEAESLSPATPYLEPPVGGPRLAVRRDQQSLRVGLAWSGDRSHPRNRNRSTGLDSFTPLLDTPGARFFGIQVGPGSSQIHTLGLEALIEDLSPSIADFADAAVLLRDIDLLIAVDSPIAHLAGAMNKEVWTAIPFSPDWRWRLRRKDSPWYPSMTLFRQTSPGDWDDVFARLRGALVRRIGT